MGTQRAREDEEITLLPNQYTRPNYLFVGWSLVPSQSVSDVVYEDQAKVKNLTDVNGKTVGLYAVWVRDRLTEEEGIVFRKVSVRF